MLWFQGSIPEAIGASRNRKCIFVVVVTTEDEDSRNLLARLEDEEVSKLFNSCVSISLKNGTSEANQFSQLYPLVILPAIYMIGLQGSPLEVIGGLVDIPTLLKRAQLALEAHDKQQNVNQILQPADNRDSPETTAHSTEASHSSRSDEASKSESENNDVVPGNLPLEARLERADQLLALVREKKNEEEREKEKIKERERRELGKQLQQLKEMQRERELREQADSRQKEKREEKEALEKIRQQILQDRADRAARYQAAQISEEERRRTAQSAQEQLQQERASAARSAFARLQFRLPDGSTRTDQFSSDAKLSAVIEFIDREIQPNFRPYTISTTFPRRQFDEFHMQQTLRELDLSPSAALLIIPAAGSKPKASTSASPSLFSSLFARVFLIWNWIWTFFSNPTPRVTDDVPAAQQQPSNHGVRRRRPDGNIHRLSDASPDDSSDDNGTWNGNSTQQL
ncbi:UBX domain-containing protein 4-like [Daphnia carinata]|uniref:UBX domain-containing protein 4-like n=1 Tax=Daphnia carinata TaxID=120202 RepID=UPI00257D5B00|nr:UBX domain-containing protein 4-like [Daphnia carinata]